MRASTRMAGTVALGLVAALSMPTGAASAAVSGTGPAAARDRPPVSGNGPAVAVIVRYDAGVGPAGAERVIARAGGTVGKRLGVVDGFTARVPRASLPALRAAAGVLAVTPNGAVRLAGDEVWLADEDLNSLYSVTRSAGAQAAWSQSDDDGDKITGAGVGVALIDSGVSPVQGLTTPGKIVNGPDLSFESQAGNLRYLDTFGHGTHLAGIIAGRDPGLSDADLTDPRQFVGVAPGAHVISLKVAAADGATDVSQVIAAIDWVVQHRDDPGMNIRVLNLSFGTDSVQDARLDPLSYAVEVAWRKGIVVVVAVGNDGAAQTTVSMPAANPYVIAVGAVDPHETAARQDDTLATFSTAGNHRRHADILAAGRSVVSLRNPGSYVDAHYPEGRLAGDPAQRYFRGSGTSQSTAVVSGAAALLLQRHPDLSPDQVKKALTDSAEPLPASSKGLWGTGQLALGPALSKHRKNPPKAKQKHQRSTGLGTLEGSRGTAHVADPETDDELTGERDIFGEPWLPAVWAPAAARERSWHGGTWNGTAWTGPDWTGTSWAARTWSGRTWSGVAWSGLAWAGRTWSDAVWTGRTWSGRTWSGRTWSGRTWSGGYWS